MAKKHKPEPKLNDPLCPEEFKICVPWSSKLLGPDWDPRNEKKKGDAKIAWEDYVRTLTHTQELPLDWKEPKQCWTCCCEPGWELTGELAVAHACRVHDKIHRQVLGFELVSAIDVGFAILERETKFENSLAIRVHVNRKLPPELLLRAGSPSLTRFDHYMKCHCGSCDCPKKELCEEVSRILNEHRDRMSRQKSGRARDHYLPKLVQRYPIGGVSEEDLSICFSPRPGKELPERMEDLRLCICGVPIDIVNAQYGPSVTHPGGDADSGVFVDPPQRSNELQNDELQLIGRGRVNPLVGGISVGSVTGQAGTLGTIVWDRTDGTPCVLSNWHVLAGTATAQVGQPTYQPALFDGGTEDDEIAHLKRWYLGEEGDAAIAELADTRHHASGEILGMWHPISGYLRPELNMEVRKWGRSTGFTQGFVDGIHLATNIDYGNGVVRYFKEQFHIAPLCAGEDVSQVGDSGSLVLTSFRPKGQKAKLSALREALAWHCCWLQLRGREELYAKLEAAQPRSLRACTNKKCGAYCEVLKAAFEVLREACQDKMGYQALYQLIQDQSEALRKAICNESDPCKKLGDEIDGFFGRWQVRCCAIVIAEKRCEKLLKRHRDRTRDETSLLFDCTDNVSSSTARPEVVTRQSKPDEFEVNLQKELEKIGFVPANISEDWFLQLLKQRLTCEPKNTTEDWFLQLLKRKLSNEELLEALIDQAANYLEERKNCETRGATRVYYAVGMIFAGDTPGSPFGEFAVASDIARLEKELRFSLRPVFEPRSSFRELRVRPPGRGRTGRALRSRRSLTPGTQGADPRTGGPQPDLEPGQSGPETGGG